MHFGPGLAVGFVLILIAATMNGAFALPMKIMTKWKWENTWMVWTISSLWVLPPLIALATIPGLGGIYRATPAAAFVKMSVFGILWGIGLFMLGLAYPIIGVAVAFAVGLGSAAAAGSLLPLLGQHSQQVFTRTGILILAGIIVMLAGVAVCGWAGREREREQGISVSAEGKSLRGFLIAFVGGTLTAALNIALAYGDQILRAVRMEVGNTSLAANAVWVPVLLAGGIPGVVYCAWLMRKNSSARLYSVGPATYWLLALVMSTLWYGSVILYGVGAMKIGELGAIIGWPIFMSGAVLAGSGWGALTGEWRGSQTKSRLMMAGGVSLLIVAVAILGMAG
jgi:L-rhamnose-H+ transport protein